ncbi:MAG TPA: non-homologous end-joining DNA ligase [Capillibacterium sp.]
MVLPLRIAPMLAVSAPPFDSPAYSFEIKWDGLRCLAFLEKATRLQSRNGRTITFQYPELFDLHRQVKAAGVVLDGELIVLADGRPSFSRLQNRMHATSAAGIQAGARHHPVVYVVFDLLYYQGKSLMAQPLEARQELLHQVVTPGPHLIISEAIPGAGQALFDRAAALGLEGVVGKARNSPYLPGRRSPYWKKARVTKSADFVICGYTTKPEGRADLSALVIGLYTGEKLVSYGLVGTGLGKQEIDHLLHLFYPLRRENPPLTDPPALKMVHWLEPGLVCEVEYLAVTPDRRLRHPLYKGLRERPPQECRVENLQ